MGGCPLEVSGEGLAYIVYQPFPVYTIDLIEQKFNVPLDTI